MGERAMPLPATRFLQEKHPPPEAKKQSELQGNADSNAEIFPHPSLKKKKCFPQLEEKNKN